MIERVWGNEYRKTLVCVDSYHKGVLEGRFFNPYLEGESFESLSQFLIKMESLLDRMQLPQSYTATRTFASALEQSENQVPLPQARKGAMATFEVRVIFRQHASWQGMVVWQEKHQEQSFRSVLELVLLMDSALREGEGSGAA